MVALLLKLCEASELQGGFSFGGETVTNDPFLIRSGPHLSGWLAFSPMAQLGIGGSWYPDMQGYDLKPLTDELMDDFNLAPDISRIYYRAEVQLVLMPFATEWKSWETRAGLSGGMGLVYTVDDLEFFGAAGEEEHEKTKTQLHPAFSVGITGVVRTDFLGFRWYVERVEYVETVGSLSIEQKQTLLIGTEVQLWFP